MQHMCTTDVINTCFSKDLEFSTIPDGAQIHQSAVLPVTAVLYQQLGTLVCGLLSIAAICSAAMHVGLNLRKLDRIGSAKTADRIC